MEWNLECCNKRPTIAVNSGHQRNLATESGRTKQILPEICWLISLSGSNRRLRGAGVNDGRSKRSCSKDTLCVSFHVIDGQNTRDQITIDRRSEEGRTNVGR